MLLNELINDFQSESLLWGATLRNRSSLISPYFKNEFNLSAGHQYVIPILASVEKSKLTKVSINELCLRRLDLERVGVSPIHLLLFEMGVAGYFGDFNVEDYETNLLEFTLNWLSKIGIPKDKLLFTISQGANIFNVEFKPDEVSYNSLIRVGVSPQNIIKTYGRRNFIFSEGEHRPAGYSIEIFFRGLTSFVEIASLNKYFLLYDTKKLKPTLNFALGCGLGFERISFVLNNSKSVFDTDIYSDYFYTLKSIFGKVEMELFNDRLSLIAELIRALIFTIGDGQNPDDTSRGRIQKSFMKKLKSESLYLNLYPASFIPQAICDIITPYKVRYPHLIAKRDSILKIIMDYTY